MLHHWISTDSAKIKALASYVTSCVISSGGGGGGGRGGGGFDDSDFRKTGPLKTPKYRANSTPSNNAKKGKDFGKHPKTLPKPKIHPLQLNPVHVPDEKKSNIPKYPLMKAVSLSRHWYDDAEEIENRLMGEEAKKLPMIGPEELKSLRAKKDLAETLLVQYTSGYEVTRRKSGDMRLLETTARSGTSVDKVSAFTCLVEDNPMANMRALDALLSMVTSKVGKRFAFSGYDALKELFLLRLLPNRKLKCLIQRPMLKIPENKDGYSLLLFWFFEECLKQRYEKFVISLEEAMKDSLPNLKDKAMKTVYALLKSKPEQERKLLSSLVNKLGDPDRKAASNAGYQLTCLLSEHPNMKAVVIDEVDHFLFRPHIGLRSKYYAVNFLSQFFLSKRGDGPKVAKRLVDVYFALFKVLIFEATNGKMHEKKKNEANNQKSRINEGNYKEKTISSLKSNKQGPYQETHTEMDSRLLSALLTGVNRAFPYVSSEEADDILEVQTPIIFKLVHSENFNVGVQALMLLYQITTKNQIASDRFYRALYAKLLNPAAVSSSKPEMFLGLMAKAMKNDLNLKRVSAFSKRLMQDHRTWSTISKWRLSNGLYLLDVPYTILSTVSTVDWHRRLGHAPLPILKKALPDISLREFTCESCIYDKQHRTSFPPTCTRSDTPFSFVHSNLAARATKCIFVGYSRTQKDYVYYFSTDGKLIVSADVTFFEDQPFHSPSTPSPPSTTARLVVLVMTPSLLPLPSPLLVALQRPPQYACGCLFLLSEVLKEKPTLWRVVLQKEFIDDEVEHFEDIVEEDQETSEKNSKLTSFAQNGKMLDFMVSKEDSNSDKENKLYDDSPRAGGSGGDVRMKAQPFQGGSSLPGGYDPRLREPVYCNADRTGLWELTMLASHVHPSVSTMAGTLLSGAHIVYNGDPLNDLSLGSFLDKFMEKKARPSKAEHIWHGGSQIAPAKKLDPTHHLIGEEILRLAEEDVPPEDVVFHRFYMNKTTSSKKSKAKKKALGDDDGGDLLLDGEDQSEEDEDEVDDLLGAGGISLGGEDEGFDYDDLDRNCHLHRHYPHQRLHHRHCPKFQQHRDAKAELTSDPSANDDEASTSDHDVAEICDSDGDEDAGDGSDDGDDNSSHTGSKKAKAKAEKKSGSSPSASLEDFDHLTTEDRSQKVSGMFWSHEQFFHRDGKNRLTFLFTDLASALDYDHGISFAKVAQLHPSALVLSSKILMKREERE
ncbi:hypothetical protein KSP40_PGU009186 [Platanthera guangdongensis]|uniref:CCAAT-binding factor domain-containing protein n=1 Tax=Platanthera guangdongensis TaxID=2320717 RepID=A0ABR2MCA7_9ASPA